MLEYTLKDFDFDVNRIAAMINKFNIHIDSVAGIPQGGIPFAMALAERLGLSLIAVKDWKPAWVKKHAQNTLIVDDLINSGRTIQPFIEQGFPVAVLGYKPSSPYKPKIHTYMGWDNTKAPIMFGRPFEEEWIHFWWEKPDVEKDPIDHITRVIEYLGEDPNRAGLLETPERVVRSWKELYGGYHIDPASVFKEFDEPVDDDMVIMRNISFTSTCEHHMLPFMGMAHIAYIPKGNKVIGASKMIRLLEIFAHRLQIQERIARQVVDTLDKYLECLGSACIIEAVHSCILCRGAKNATSELVTPVLSGVFKDKDNVATRAELYSLIRK